LFTPLAVSEPSKVFYDHVPALALRRDGSCVSMTLLRWLLKQPGDGRSALLLVGQHELFALPRKSRSMRCAKFRITARR
jgi:hypothetical protein